MVSSNLPDVSQLMFVCVCVCARHKRVQLLLCAAPCILNLEGSSLLTKLPSCRCAACLPACPPCPAVSSSHILCPPLQPLPTVLAAAAEAEATTFIITSGPSARAGTKSSGGGGLFAFGGGAKGAARAAQLAEKAGVEKYVVLRAAGLDATSVGGAPGLVVAEAGSLDPALAGKGIVRGRE